ncbi:kinase-like protein [Lenzites betulinus]|nr:kinase-like protein [Lenzites betulinus]
MAPRFVYRLLSVVVSALPLRIRRTLWSYLLRAGAERWSVDGVAQRIPGGMFIKHGLTRPVEAQATHFVGTHTSIPVPVVIDCLTVEGRTWIVLSRLPGYNLGDRYFDVTPEVEQHLSSQLSRMLTPLRALPPPNNSAVCGFDQGPIYCARMAFGGPARGPFENVESFHRWLLARAGPLKIPAEEDAEQIRETIKRAHSRPQRVCLTHNDLGPHNILVDEEWNITGIVDWESCAWMPEYWELSKGTFLLQYRDDCWDRVMTSVFPEYSEELKAERYILSYRSCYW